MVGPRRRVAMVGSWQGRRACPYRVDTGATEDAARGRPARPGGSALHRERALTYGGYFASVSPNTTFAAIAVTATSGWRSGFGPSATAQETGNANSACRAKLVAGPEKNATPMTAVAKAAQGR